MATVPANNWMQWFLGTSEEGVMADRSGILVDGAALLNKETGQHWPTGRFETVTVAELIKRAEILPVGLPAPSWEPVVTFRVADGVEIGSLQASLKTADRALVLVASNFNCAEVSSRVCRPDYGNLVEHYASDTTQGPAACYGVPAAALLRVHFPFYAPGKPAVEWGQTGDQQIELLANVRNYFGSCENGIVTLKGTEEPISLDLVESVANEIQIGLHVDAQVVFGQLTRGELNVLPEPYALVDQVLASSVNWQGPGVTPCRSQLECLTRASLRAAYDGAYLAAILRARRLLILTLVGGDTFAIPEAVILEEIAAAHRRWVKHHAFAIEEVRLCLYQAGQAARVEPAMQTLLACTT